MTIKKADMEYINKETVEFLDEPFIFDPEHFGGVKTAKENLEVELLYAPDWNKWIDAMFFTAFTTWDNGYEIDLKSISMHKRAKLTLDFVKKRPISAVSESATFVFRINNLSRAMTHQIVRHRAMAFNQESFRVSPAHHADIRVSDDMDEHQKQQIGIRMDMLRAQYVKLVESGVPIEQARNVLPMGTCTHITMVTTLKALMDYFKARTLEITQDEHTYMVARMLQELKTKAPEFYEHFIKSEKLEQIMKQYLG